jgi:hypothetical protein
VELNGASRNDSALVYFDGLYQVQQNASNLDLLKNNQTYLDAVAKNTEDAGTQSSDISQQDVIDRLIFEQVAYTKFGKNPSYDLSSDFSASGTGSAQVTFMKSEYSEVA